MRIHEVRKRAGQDEIDYTFLMDCLKEYKSPRAKLTRFLKSGELIRVKKGMYLLGRDFRQQVVSLELWANKIYGPSYVSLEYALAFYGLIPEHVVEVTSVTTGRKKNFNTPIGRFSYYPLPLPLYQVGYTLMEIGQNRRALMATKEKALADLFYFRRYKIKRVEEMKELLFEDLRMEPSRIYELDASLLLQIRHAKGSPLIDLLIQLIQAQQ
jgi:Transcriptional regulator, AbiEi antitoxin